MKPALKFDIGTRINHPKFGNGTIKTFWTWGQFEVAFDNYVRQGWQNGWQVVDYDRITVI